MKTGGKKSPTDMELMLYADGELPPDEASQVAAWLDGDADARLKLESLRQVGEAVRTYTELETDRAEVEVPAFADMWQRIDRRIHANGRAERAAEEAPAPGRRRASGTTGAAGLWAAVRRWYEDHRGHVLTGALSAGVAVALMLALGPRQQEEIARDGGSAGRVVPPVAMAVSQPPEVENLEVYEGSGTILTIEPEDKGDSAATVIWISNDEENREGPL